MLKRVQISRGKVYKYEPEANDEEDLPSEFQVMHTSINKEHPPIAIHNSEEHERNPEEVNFILQDQPEDKNKKLKKRKFSRGET